MGYYTRQWEPHWLEVVERSLPIDRLPEALRGASLVQLSDLHIGPQVDEQYLMHTFRRVRQLAPEIVVYTGDFITFDGKWQQRVERLCEQFPTGNWGTFGVLGNHDYGPGFSRNSVAEGIVQFTGTAGIRILRNEIAEVRGLQIAGLDDLWARRFAPTHVFPRLDAERASLTLCHNPDAADREGWGNYCGWILSGHTHGGQCKPPFLPPPLLPVQNRRYQSGAYELSQGRRMYISRGVGHLLQVRFNVRPEVTRFRLERA